MNTTSLDGRPPLSTTPPRRLSDAELEQRHRLAYPEAAGPAVECESGEMRYGVNDEALARVGQPPHVLDPAIRDAENRSREQRLAAMSPAERQAREDMAAVVRAELRGMR